MEKTIETEEYLLWKREFWKTANIEDVKNVVEQCDDINARISSWMSPLHYAAELGKNPKMVKVLVDYGADVNAGANRWPSALHLATYNCHSEVATILLDAGADVNARNEGGFTPLHWAASNENPEVAVILLDAGADIDARGRDVDIHGRFKENFLYEASLENKTPWVKAQLSEYGELPYTRDEDGVTPLHLAALKNNDTKVVEVLLDREVDIDVDDGCGYTPLHYSVYGNATYVDAGTEVMEFLLRRGADIQSCAWDGKTPLHYAVELANGNPDAVKVLMDGGADVKAIDAIGNTPLHWAAAEHDYPEVVEALLDGDADINAPDQIGGTPLHWTARYNRNVEVLALLLDRGANVNARDDFGYTSLHEAASENNNPEVVELLLVRGANVNDEYNDVDSPLNLAVLQEFGREVVEVLLDQGAEVSTRNERGETPLHGAVGKRNKDVVKMLLERGADANAQDERGDSPLHVTAGYGNSPDILALLLEKGGNVHARNNAGKTVMDRACENNITRDIEVFLRSHINKMNTIVQSVGISHLERTFRLKRHEFLVRTIEKHIFGAFPKMEEEAYIKAREFPERTPPARDSQIFTKEDHENMLLAQLTDARRQIIINSLAMLYFQWEREFQSYMAKCLENKSPDASGFLIQIMDPSSPKRQESLHILRDIGWPPRTERWYSLFKACHCIVNVHKHGDGESLRKLTEEYPQYLKSPPDILKYLPWPIVGKDGKQLEVSQEEFNELSTAIGKFWETFPGNQPSVEQIREWYIKWKSGKDIDSPT